MQTDDDQENISAFYGLLPTLAGFAFAGGLIWFMFWLADGFA